MKILITGGTGLIGRSLVKSLLADGHRVIILSRSSRNAEFLPGAEIVQWDGSSPKGWGHLLNDTDAVINLAGESIGSFPWYKSRKIKFRQSRMAAGAALVAAFQASAKRPHTLIQASAVGYYGFHAEEFINENATAGDDFSSALCRDWEASTLPIEEMGVRRLIIRSGIVLSKRGGVLPLMALPVRLFVGGPLGNGRQGIPWIHLEDEVAAIRFLLENKNLTGVFNLSAPNPVSNANFTRSLAQVLHRPYWLPVPGFALKLALGEMSTLVLDGHYLIPERLLEAGFKFKYTDVEPALGNLYKENA
jgi:uncharacterized protein (TIGR01777 family)